MARRPKSTDAAGPGAPDGQPAFSLSHAVNLIRTTVPPMDRAGAPFVAAPLALALAGRRRRYVRGPALAAAAVTGAFFRNPPRVPPTRPGVVVAPADGEAVLVDHAPPPAELGLGDAPLQRVSIFLSVLDVHTQRSPVTGVVERVEYRKGRFLSADLPDAAEVNERNAVVLRTPDGHRVISVQIAGLLARRIVCRTGEGSTLGIGETYGLIRFGSRVDTYLPAGARILVERGQRTVGGETVLAELPAEADSAATADAGRAGR
ncbi:phosphatidylserine decarboxylase [Tomitella fengzijianii]|uniref:phosphatidylserine decarboxylase n=1 Tax=Tomitella fengzijianii TaxID=2597660 RepID=UPI0022A74D74|nr:phosphatidylserine decarboxylase [Tomitella fengzijianii]